MSATYAIIQINDLQTSNPKVARARAQAKGLKGTVVEIPDGQTAQDVAKEFLSLYPVGDYKLRPYGVPDKAQFATVR